MSYIDICEVFLYFIIFVGYLLLILSFRYLFFDDPGFPNVRLVSPWGPEVNDQENPPVALRGFELATLRLKSPRLTS